MLIPANPTAVWPRPARCSTASRDPLRSSVRTTSAFTPFTSRSIRTIGCLIDFRNAPIFGFTVVDQRKHQCVNTARPSDSSASRSPSSSQPELAMTSPTPRGAVPLRAPRRTCRRRRSRPPERGTRQENISSSEGCAPRRSPGSHLLDRCEHPSPRFGSDVRRPFRTREAVVFETFAARARSRIVGSVPFPVVLCVEPISANRLWSPGLVGTFPKRMPIVNDGASWGCPGFGRHLDAGASSPRKESRCPVHVLRIRRSSRQRRFGSTVLGSTTSRLVVML